MKTKKTLSKRVRITKNGKVMKKQTRTGHLKAKMSSGRRNRKKGQLSQPNAGHIKKLKAMLNI